MLSDALRSEASRSEVRALESRSFAEVTLSTQGEILRFAQDDMGRAQEDSHGGVSVCSVRRHQWLVVIIH